MGEKRGTQGTSHGEFTHASRFASLRPLLLGNLVTLRETRVANGRGNADVFPLFTAAGEAPDFGGVGETLRLWGGVGRGEVARGGWVWRVVVGM